MNVICFANNLVGIECVKHLRASGTNLQALVVHESGRQKMAAEIIDESGLPADHIFTGNQLKDPQVIQRLFELKPDCGVSAFFGYIFRRPIIDLFPRGIVNLHTSLLPLNRGSFPNVWTIVDQTAAGVTMHLVDEGVDTGSILAQAQVEVSPADTGQTLNKRLESTMIELFKDNWESFAQGNLEPVMQNENIATSHMAKDTELIDKIDLEKSYVARDLINILRARTYPPYRGAWFEIDGQKYFLKLEIEKE